MAKPRTSLTSSLVLTAFVGAAAATATACSDDGGATDGGDSGVTSPVYDATADTSVTPHDASVGPGNDAAPQVDAAPPADSSVSPDAGDASPPDAALPDAAACGGPCAPGFACSPQGVCKSAHGVPQFGNVYLLVMENHSAKTITASADAPYITSLIAANASATAYKDSLQHPSLPNYIALASGDTYNIACDCQPGTESGTCGGLCILNAACNCNQGTSVKSLADQIETAGKKWRSYGDGATGICDTTNHDHYAMKHIPFLYFDAIRTSARCANIVPFPQLGGELGTYDFSFVTPDLCHDMHDSCAPENNNIKQGDNWLQANVHTITDSAKFKKDGVLFITWDEGDPGLIGNDDNVELIVISPFIKGAGTTTNANYDHYSLLATIQEGLGLPRLAKSVPATAIGDIWR